VRESVRSGILLCTNARRILYMGFTLLLDMFLFGLNMIDGAELNHNLKRTSKREQLCLSLIEEALETSGKLRS